MAKTKATQADVDAFIRAVCPEAPELYAAAFTEKKCLNDATEIITRYRGALDQIENLNPEAEEVREAPSIAAYALNPRTD